MKLAPQFPDVGLQHRDGFFEEGSNKLFFVPNSWHLCGLCPDRLVRGWRHSLWAVGVPPPRRMFCSPGNWGNFVLVIPLEKWIPPRKRTTGETGGSGSPQGLPQRKTNHQTKSKNKQTNKKATHLQVIDWGLCCPMSRTRAIAGSLSYAAPELILAKAGPAVNLRSCVWAWGVAGPLVRK